MEAGTPGTQTGVWQSRCCGRTRIRQPRGQTVRDTRSSYAQTERHRVKYIGKRMPISLTHWPAVKGTPVLLALILVLAATGVLASVAAEPQTNAGPNHLLLIDRFGKSIRASTNEVPSSLQPPASVGLGQQIPSPAKGAPMSEEARQRIMQSKTGREWFPTTPRVLMPCLGSLDDFGNTAIQEGALIPIEPHSSGCQVRPFRIGPAL
jgi:hypothetical protein